MKREPAIKVRTLWRWILIIGATLGLVILIAGLITNHDQASQAGQNIFATSLIGLALSHISELRERVTELERREEQRFRLEASAIRRLADLMDSARRLDPTYRAAEARRKDFEAYKRGLKKDHA